jgi:hypothetical protein
MDRLGELNTSPALMPLLREVRRRLWLRQLGRGLAWSSWLVVAASVMTTAVSAALSERPGLLLMWSTAGVLYLAAALVVSARPPGTAAVAAWADRQLGGASAYTASLEFHGADRGSVDPAALEYLDSWAAAAAETSRRQLHATPSRWLPTRSLAAALVALALASLTMALPADGGAASTDGLASVVPAAPVMPTQAVTDLDRLASELAREPPTRSSAEDGVPESDSHRANAQLPGPADANRQPAAAADLSGMSPPSAGSTSSGGGEQAGAADAGDEPGQRTEGDLRLRVTRRDIRVDAEGERLASAATAGSYRDQGAGGSRPGGAPTPGAPAARLPDGSRAGSRGPLANELVNRYFAERGKQP